MRTGYAVSQRLKSMQQCLFEATTNGHTFVFRKIIQQSRQPLFKPNRNIYPFNFDWRTHVVYIMPKRKLVAIGIPDTVVMQPIVAIRRWLNNLYSIRGVKLVQLFRIVYHKINIVARGSWHISRQMNCYFTNTNSCKIGRITPCELNVITKLAGIIL